MSKIDSPLPPLTAPHRPDGVALGISAEASGRAFNSSEHDPQKQKLRRACLDFEGFFIGMLLKQMRSSEIKGGLFGQSSEAGLYREMLDDSMAKEIGMRGAFGIADMLYRELVVTLERKQS